MLRRLNPEAAKRERERDVVAEQTITAEPGEVILYCTSWCPACRKARAWLDQRNVRYTVIDVDFNQAAAEKVRGWANGNLTTPTFDFGGTIVVDFDEERLAAVLEVFRQGGETGVL